MLAPCDERGVPWLERRGVVSQCQPGVQIKCLVVHLCRIDHSSVAAATMLRRRKEKRKEGCRRVGVLAACSTPHEPESKWRKERVPLVLSLFSVAAEASSCYTTARSSACLVRVARG